MAQNIKGENAIEILRQPEVYKCFTDADNPLTKQVIYRLSDWFFNKEDIRKIENADRDEGPTAAAAMLLECLIKRYNDQPDKLTLADFIEALDNQNTNVKLVKLLNSIAENALNFVAKVNKIDSPMVKDIKARLQFTCENVAKVWGKLLSETSLEKCFVKPEIVEEELGEDGEKRRKETGKTVNCYEELFQCESFGDRIVIEGDPGMGKTTYVNKLALDWTWDEGTPHYSNASQFLGSNFAVVFLIPLRSLNGGKSVTLAQAAEIQLRGCGPWLVAQFQQNPAKSLLILDAFDEYDGSCQDINEIIEGTLFPRLKVIITTRPSHIDRLEIKNQWLAITGLTTPEKRERFLIKQGWDKMEERDIVIHVWSGLGTLWHTPLYLAMLCVLHKAKKVTNFEPHLPNCFYILVKLFTEHIMSRSVKEKGLKLKKEERLKLKSYMQHRAFQQFQENNPWLENIISNNYLGSELEADDSLSDSEDVKKLAGQIGLIIIQEEQSPLTGEDIETVSFIHQMFVEYYAATQFWSFFTNYNDADELVNEIEKNLNLTHSPFSYFLAAECISYREMLIKRQTQHFIADEDYWMCINIDKFAWLPEINISNEILNNVPEDLMTNFWFFCDRNSMKSFWDADYIKELCSIAEPTKVRIDDAFIGYHYRALDSILSSVNDLQLVDCNCKHIKMPKKVYPNLAKFRYKNNCSQGIDEMLNHFTNLGTLILLVPITDITITPLCDSLRNMNQLVKLSFDGCFKSPQSASHVIELAKTIENTSAIWKNLKILYLCRNVLDTETESSTEVLFKVISKCSQLWILQIFQCQIKLESFAIIKEIIEKSDNLKNNMKRLFAVPKKWDESVKPEQRILTMITDDELTKWKSEVQTILPDCQIDVGN